jgi:hypothetical protein
MAYIGRGLQSGAFRQLDDISSGFDGSDTTHTMQVNSTNVTVGDVNQILLSLGGVIQKPGTDFTVSASVLTFTTAPAANTSFFAILLGSDNGGTVTPTDGSVTGDKVASDIAFTTSGAVTANGGLKADNITIDGTEIDLSSGDLTLDAAGRIDLSADDNGEVRLFDGSSNYGQFKDDDDRLKIQGLIADKDMLLVVNNGGSEATSIVIDSIGAVTKPLQPAFQVRGASNVTNYSVNTTHDVVFGTEVFDQNADISSNTFTAPITGRYLLNTSLYLINADSGADYHQLDLVTSNRNNYAIVGTNVFSADSNYFSINITVLADMDANDTAKVQYYQSGGAATTDSSGIGSWFSGHLAC